MLCSLCSSEVHKCVGPFLQALAESATLSCLHDPTPLPTSIMSKLFLQSAKSKFPGLLSNLAF